MGYILPETFMSLCEGSGIPLPKTIIETGTFKGGIFHRFMETYNSLPSVFDKYYTIELGEDICKIASKRFLLAEENNCTMTPEMWHADEMDESFEKEKSYFDNRLTLIQGDSSIKLKELLSSINDRCCFWLDAHAGAQKYARGNEDVPLLKELDIIKNHHIKNHIIAIDDAHLFGKKQYDKSGNLICDYTNCSLDNITNKILEIDSEYDVGIYRPYGMDMILSYLPDL